MDKTRMGELSKDHVSPKSHLTPANPPLYNLIHSPEAPPARINRKPFPMILAAFPTQVLLDSLVCKLDMDKSLYAVGIRDFSWGCGRR